MQKQAIIIGLGQFGMSVARALAERGVEVLAVDTREDASARRRPLRPRPSVLMRPTRKHSPEPRRRAATFAYARSATRPAKRLLSAPRSYGRWAPAA